MLNRKIKKIFAMQLNIVNYANQRTFFPEFGNELAKTLN